MANLFDKFPMGHAFQMGVALGHIKNDIYLSQDKKDPETYYAAFILSTRTSEEKHTELHCYVTGDEAYSFATKFQKFDIIQIWFEVNHAYEYTTQHVKNRCHILGWASYKEFPVEGIPQMDDDEMAFINKMLKLYRESAPLPSKNEVYVWKSIVNNWKKERRKETTDSEEKKNIVEVGDD